MTDEDRKAFAAEGGEFLDGLPLVGSITPLDVNGVLFVEFPIKETLEQSRRALLRWIRDAGWDEISWGSIDAAFRWRRMKAFAALPPDERRRRFRAAHGSRFLPPHERAAAPTAAPARQPWEFD